MEETGTGESIIELEFDIGDTEFFLVTVSEASRCEIRLHEMQQRADGRVLEFFSIEGADPETLSALVGEVENVDRVRLLNSSEDSALFSAVSETAVAQTLAETETRMVDVVAKAGEGRLVVEVLPHVDTQGVVDSFLETYPDAELVARRTTDREAPLVTPTQAHESLLSDLTDRQLETLRLAHARGYFEWPRETTTDALADQLGVSSPTVSQHLRAVQRKVFDRLLVRSLRRSSTESA